jgi:NADPH-ferrihemoprotein reductase
VLCVWCFLASACMPVRCVPLCPCCVCVCVSGATVTAAQSNLARLGEIEKSFAIFCMATYGEGDPTDNAQEFCSLLKDSVASSTLDLSSLNYTVRACMCACMPADSQRKVFGLGNKTYEMFNETARVVDKSLAKLGAHRLHERGEGDDSTQYDDCVAA